MLSSVVDSPRERRGDTTQVIELAAFPTQIGVRGEPHLWWRFRNLTAQPIPMLDLLRDHTLWLDGRAHRAPEGHYNGSRWLQPQSTFTGMWSLDDFESSTRRGERRVELEILGLRSRALVVEWRDLGDPVDPPASE